MHAQLQLEMTKQKLHLLLLPVTRVRQREGRHQRLVEDQGWFQALFLGKADEENLHLNLNQQVE
jgi:hypothetical protein